MARFPTVVDCATSPLAVVVRMWGGLGYNRRAVNLHRAAVAAGGELPDTLEGLMSLPGIGPYTARAVLAFAHERDVGVVDTNAARVLARWEGSRLTAKQVQAAADRHVPEGEGWAWNQAVLDLGATVCLRRAPKCDRCPVSSTCAWFAAGRPEPDPADGSAGVSGGQSRFEGSDRQGRGRLVDALRARPVRDEHLALVMGWPDDPERAARVAITLVHDGLASRDDGLWSLCI
jgi:A/G-specific adenine glycosylase